MGIDTAINTLVRCMAPLALGTLLRAKGAGIAFGGTSGSVFGAAGQWCCGRGISRLTNKYKD